MQNRYARPNVWKRSKKRRLRQARSMEFMRKQTELDQLVLLLLFLLPLEKLALRVTMQRQHQQERPLRDVYYRLVLKRQKTIRHVSTDIRSLALCIKIWVCCKELGDIARSVFQGYFCRLSSLYSTDTSLLVSFLPNLEVFLSFYVSSTQRWYTPQKLDLPTSDIIKSVLNIHQLPINPLQSPKSH
jgi:hypothetical protein